LIAPLPLLRVAGGIAPALLLLLELALEAFAIDREALFLGDLAHQVRVETVGVVEAKHRLAGEQRRARLLGLLDRLLHTLRGGGDGRQELLFLGPDGLARRSLGRAELGIRLPHHLAEHRHEPIEERLVEAQPHPVPHRAAAATAGARTRAPRSPG
jgi:hypothetical protein